MSIQGYKAKLFILFLVFLAASFTSFGQKINEVVKMTNKIIVNQPDQIVYAEVLPYKTKIKTKDNVFYFWFNANEIKRTKGGFGGRVLNGNFTSYYPDKNLKESGKYNNGIKTGNWKSWHKSGEYKEIVNWKQGLRSGKYQVYNSDGFLIEEGFYKKDKLNGTVKKYADQKLVSAKKFRGDIEKGKKDKLENPKTNKRDSLKKSKADVIASEGKNKRSVDSRAGEVDSNNKGTDTLKTGKKSIRNKERKAAVGISSEVNTDKKDKKIKKAKVLNEEPQIQKDVTSGEQENKSKKKKDKREIEPEVKQQQQIESRQKKDPKTGKFK